MKDYTENRFIFSPRYRFLRHMIFWTVHILVFSFLFKVPAQSWWLQHAESLIWVLAFILYCYPIMYVIIPRFLLKGKLVQFFSILIMWGVAGYFFNFLYRKYVFFPLTAYFSAKMSLPFIYANANPWAPSGFIVMNLMAGYGSMIVLFKYWVKKQKDFLQAEKDKINAELQLLKAQVHPHFLFNTLNNIYSFALQQSPKTPELVLKLSSLLSYILYDCKQNEVPLEKELQVMKNYIDLEKERYAKLEVSLNLEGDIKDKWIAPLLLLPFLENAFKHGTSEQLETSWLSMDVSVRQNSMRCKIANSKNEMTLKGENGIGIENV
ncbi:MAG TPA: histidine kinase, partial [Chitinophagaceae bacterium]|nr:histidine kinase [Chitinophagaceae bacterium]